MNEECLVKDLSFRVHHTMLPVADLDPDGHELELTQRHPRT
jgi:hypothetical protein